MADPDTPSKAWALDKLARANRIFEPDQTSWQTQLAEFVCWLAQWALMAWLAWRFLS